MKYSILLILILACSAFGQKIGEPPLMKGETIKSRKESQKAQRKAEEKARKENEKKLPSDDLDKVGLFPQNYVDQTLRFKFVIISGLENYSENGETAYFATIEKGERTYYSGLHSGGLSFLMLPSLAEQFYASSKKYADGYGNNIPAHITVNLKSFNLPNGRTTYVAGIKCIELISVMGIKMEKIGECEQ